MEVAIQLEKIQLGEDRVVFKTIGLIKGHYDDNSKLFTDEYGYEYDRLEYSTLYCDRYFCSPTTMNELRDVYGKDYSDNEMLEDFIDNYLNICYLGYYDYVDGRMKFIEVNFAQIEQTLSNTGSKVDSEESIVEFDLENNQRFVLDLNTLKELKECQTVDEIKTFIDNLLAAGEYIKDIVKDEATNTIEKEEVVEEDNNQQLKLMKEESTKFNLKDMRDFVLSEIVAQDEAVKRITTRILTNFKSSDYRRKSHLLIMGGTGTGKSKTIELICQYLNIPFAKVDATNYTQTGYVGRSVDEMLQKLISAAGGDIELAQRGILVVDEIDKKADKRDQYGISTKAVLDTLLQITGRGTVEVDIVEDRTKKTIDFDTSNLTVILTGAFEGIEKYAQTNEHKSIGFMTDTEPKKENLEITPQMLVKYGMTPELMGRIKCIVPLRKFEEEDYIKILKYSKSSPIQIEKYYLETDEGIKFTYTANYLKAIAKKAKELDEGARGIDVAVAESLEDVHERVLNGEPIKVLKLTKKTVLNNKEYYVKY